MRVSSLWQHEPLKCMFWGGVLLAFLAIAAVTYADSSPSEVVCYQETATRSTDCGGLSTGAYSTGWESAYSAWFYANYTKPQGALSNSLWQVKHGSLAAYNISGGNFTECFDQNSILQLRIYSHDEGSSSLPQTTQPQCYNGTTWLNIGRYDDASHTGYGFTSNTDSMNDGSWDTQVKPGAPNRWLGSNPSSSSIYEEAMWWNLSLTKTPTGQLVGTAGAAGATLVLTILAGGLYLKKKRIMDKTEQKTDERQAKTRKT